jgi:hypothetical protein
MREAHRRWVKGIFIVAMLSGMSLLLLQSPLAAQTIVDEWQRVAVPPAPEL